MTSAVSVAIFNSSEDLAELLRDALEQNGFVVITARVDDVRRARSDVKALMEQHDPLVVVYDLIPPFVRQWNFVTHLRQTADFVRRAFVFTSANAAAARNDVGHTEPIVEVLGRDADCQAVVDAVKTAAATWKASVA